MPWTKLTLPCVPPSPLDRQRTDTWMPGGSPPTCVQSRATFPRRRSGTHYLRMFQRRSNAPSPWVSLQCRCCGSHSSEAVGTSSGTSALDASVKRVVLSVPTSSGKTLISQLFTLHHLSSGVGGVCFVVPTRSLAREVRRDLKVRLRLYGRTVAQERADWDLDHAQVDDAVEVMTPERLVHLLRNDVPGVLARFGLFIFDEAHSAGEGDRGFTVESAISLLHALTTSTHHRIILMSAALGNQSQIALWVDPNSTGRTAVSDWRGPRRLHAIFNTDIDWNQTPKTSMTKSRAWPNLVTYDVHGLVRLRHTSGSHTGLRTSQPLGQGVRNQQLGEYERNPETGRRKRYEARSTSNYVMLLEIITLVAEAGPVLVIRSTREQTRQLAVQLAQTLEPSSDASDLAQFASTRLGSAHPLAEVLAKGVAYHHSGLPADVLDLIEDEDPAGAHQVRGGNDRHRGRGEPSGPYRLHRRTWQPRVGPPLVARPGDQRGGPCRPVVHRERRLGDPRSDTQTQ